jgi:DNA-directed RNA polymerase subunit K/omega
VSALRAKQLRRGARPRLDQADEAIPVSKAVKAERVAMEEVKQNLVQWDLPDFKVVVDLAIKENPDGKIPPAGICQSLDFGNAIARVSNSSGHS